MMNQDWEKLGDTIKNTVQSAIDAHNFDSLNQNIMETIDHVKTHVKNVQPGRPVSQAKLPYVYRSTVSMKVWAYVSLAAGGSMGLISLLFLVFGIIGSILKGEGVFLYAAIVTLLFGIPGVIGGVLAWRGLSKLKRIRRFLSYVDIIGVREYCNVTELSEKTGRKKSSVIKDIKFMIQKRWFQQGHLVGDKTCLVVTDAMYSQYGRLESERYQSEQEERERIVQNRQQEKELQKKKEEEYAKLAPEIRKVIEEGDAYIQRIHECNDAIPGEEISAKISRMEMVIDRIFDRVEQAPESVGDIRRLMDYYLPITVKLLDAYKELDAQPVHGENIKASKAEIEATLDTLNAAFEKLLDDLFQDTAWDVSSDISVLRTMLAQEGLTEEKWKM